MIKFSATLITIASLAALCSAEIVDDVLELADSSRPFPPFSETTVGYDLHHDHFYFLDDLVSKAYQRKEYTRTKTTLAGQRDDITGTETEKCAIPWVMAQKATHGLGASSVRWDVKETKGHKGPYQFFGLYQGTGKTDFVVNKLRGHLLRQVANKIQDSLPTLDYSVGLNASYDEFKDEVQTDIKDIIARTMVEVDNDIRQSMNDDDDTGAHAVVVIVTKNFTITASAGAGRVYAYDSLNVLSDLTLGQSDRTNVFGARKSRGSVLEPYVEIYHRYYPDPEDVADEVPEDEIHTINLQFLVVESPAVGQLVNADDLPGLVLTQINSLRNQPAHEQDMFRNAATNIIERANTKVGFFTRLNYPDLSLLLIGLETDYSLIH